MLKERYNHRIIDEKIAKYESYIVFFSKYCRIAAMKNEESAALAHPPTTPIPQARPGWRNGGGWRVRQGSTDPPN